MDPEPLLARIDAAGPSDLETRLETFLAAPLDELIAAHAAAIAASHAARFGGRVILFAPLYVSSACLNDCAYCGFRRSRRGARVKLAPDEALQEARYLAACGHRTLDLVSGEMPVERFVDEIAGLCARILAGSAIETVNLNVGALSAAQYARLRDAGAAACHLYQETYDPAVYRSVHRHGPKRDMANRLDAPWRALAAGFQGIGLGVLLGLAPLRADLARLARHAHLLRAEFPAARIGFSLPRIQGAGQEPDFFAARVDDEAFQKALLFLRLEFPDAHLTLTTRERPALRDALLPLGVTKISAGACTAPGGYAARAQAGVPQFTIQDERTAAEIAARIRDAGLVPAWSQAAASLVPNHVRPSA